MKTLHIPSHHQDEKRAQVSPPAAYGRLSEIRLVVLCCAAALHAVARNHQPSLQLLASFKLHLRTCSHQSLSCLLCKDCMTLLCG